MAKKKLIQLKDGAGNALYPQVTSDGIPDGAVTTDKLGDGAVTEAKLSTDIAAEIADSKTMTDTLKEGLADPAHLEDPFVKAGIIPIPFEDEEVKKILVSKYDTDGDGEISYAEAQAVTELPTTLFNGNTRIRKFREFRFFGGLTAVREGGNYWDPWFDGAFGGCVNLTDIEFPPGEGWWGSGSYASGGKMFGGCAKLALTALPGDWTSLPNGMFRNCASLALAYLPDGLTSIPPYAFWYCTSLALTELPAGVTSIGDSAFGGCANLALTELPAGVTSIGGSAFSGCASLALTELPAGVTSIGGGAFSNCANLALTELPAGVTFDSKVYLFVGCEKLALTAVPDDWTEIDFMCFKGCKSLKLTALPSKLEKLGSCAMEDCVSCNITSIPETVKVWDENPFNRCGGVSTIKEVTLPDAQSFGWNAFGAFTSLESLTLGATPPSGGVLGLPSGCTIYVPDDAVDTYKAATNWADYDGRIKGVSEKTS